MTQNKFADNQTSSAVTRGSPEQVLTEQQSGTVFNYQPQIMRHPQYRFPVVI
ncbi:hypothetical protein [Agarivorans sp. QJM3NY_33]|uniref:hypothetical protein n=1 Tax=Agarivorans sp. QJM3NY_33 TaxID=3421432 RepID=UPI003D7E82EF